LRVPYAVAALTLQSRNVKSCIDRGVGERRGVLEMKLSKLSNLALRLLLTPLLIAIVAQAEAASIRLEPVLDNLASPLYVTHGHDSTNRLFIVEQAGRIKVLLPGATTPALFLDITSRVISGGERGLLGLAFHPQFATNARFFVNYTRQPDGATVVAEYRASADPVETAASESILLAIAQPFANHNGGMIEFGADNYLYIGMGDGGSANDPGNRAQNIDELLGKILRIDVDYPDGGLPYSSPPGNPFLGPTPGRDEIFAVGMRNPFRFSFDRQTGQLYVGDVGQGAREEIDIVTAGGNYGWRVFEGTNCTNLDPGLCNPANYVAPIGQYDHSGGRCSITGGYVYRGLRGTLPSGTYVFGDYCTGEIFELVDGAPSLLLDTSMNISSFGEDEAGEMYVVGLGGTVQRIAPLSSGGGSNVALASAGAVASASSIHSAGFPAAAVNNNERAGSNPGNGGYWNDASPHAFPDWVQIDFNGFKAIDRVVVYSVQDNYTNPVEPSDTQMFSLYGITAFSIQGWNGSTWITLATVTDNNLIRRAVTFAPFTTDRIRISVSDALDTWSRIAEIEAWGVDASAPGDTNVALASAGAMASASSMHSAGYPAAAVNNNERAGSNPGNGGYWNDASPNAFPDWVQIDFNSAKSIDRVVVYSVQDDFTNPVEPSDTQTFTLYGLTAFTVEGWNGSAWIPLASVTGNNLVKRSVTFAAFTTDRIRISVSDALDTWSRIAEIEAWAR
jgi:Glucose / Sorbosone dehydrogenase/NedA-like, galactose-binding domain